MVKEKTFLNPARKRLYGLSLMALSGIYLVTSNVLVQLLTTSNSAESIDSYGLVFTRGILTMIISAIFLIIGRINPVPSPKMIFAQTVMGMNLILGILFMYKGLEAIPIGDATAIQASIPIFTTFLSIIFLKQKVQVVDILCCGAGIIGLVIITRPTVIFGPQDEESKEICAKVTGKKSQVSLAQSRTQYFEGVVYSILSAFMLAVFFVLTKYLGKKTDFMVGLFYMGVAGIIIPLVRNVIRLTWPRFGVTVEEWITVFVIALLAFVSLIFVSESLQLEDAGPASLIRYADFVYAFIFQYFFFSIKPTILSIIGALIIVISTSALTIFRYISVKKLEEVE